MKASTISIALVVLLLGSASATRLRVPQVRHRPDPAPGGDARDGPRRRLVAGGTPTGGGKYPFLALVQYTNSSGEDGDSFRPEPYCHGVMVANDVLMKPAWCEFIEGVPLMVGDYDESSGSPSIQFIELSSERQVVMTPDQMISLEKVDPPVTFPGFAPVPIAYDAPEPRPGRIVTVVGYGSNSSWDRMYYTYDYPGVAIEAPLEVLEIDYCQEALFDSGMSDAAAFCAMGSNRTAGPCYGDYGAPVLDDDGALMGMVLDSKCDNIVIPSSFVRVPYYSSWIRDTLCALTSDDSLLLNCRNLICPAEERILGYPQAEVPDATARIKTHAGFEPVNVSQTPPAGSFINSSTKVLVTATDQTGQTESCEWTLTVPMMETIGEVYESTPSGTDDRELPLWDVDGPYYLSPGLVVMLSARLEHRLDGNSTITVSTAFNESLTLSSNVNERTLWLQNPFTNGTSDLILQSRDAASANFVVIKLFGQVA